MKRILMALAVVVALVSLAPSVAATTASAATASARDSSAPRMTPDVVLVNQPASRVCVGNRFTVGVWYQSFSGGPRAYRVAVYNPKGWLVFWTRGQAPSSAWRFWHILAWRTGKFRTVYHTKNNSGQWARYVATTTARNC
jgi:hypothetical protein